MNRYNSIDNAGMSFFSLCISSEIGWIPRSISSSDVGIDLTIEQVINGNPTAKYISVQLKTGLGNVYTNKDGDYVYYISQVHYEYWKSSSIPVILALCDLDKKVIYWELLKQYNIDKTNNQYKILIRRTHILNGASLDEFNNIIDTYQSDFELSNEMETQTPEYWSELLENCAEVISNGTRLFYQLDEKYKRVIERLSKCIGQSFQEPKSVARTQANTLKVSIDICKTQLKSQIPIIAQTHIRAIRLAESTIANLDVSPKVKSYIKDELSAELKTINSVIETLSTGVVQYEKNNTPYVELRRSENSFAIVIKEYIVNLSNIAMYIQQFINSLKIE